MNSGAKLNRLAEDEGLCYFMWSDDRGWDEPCEVKEGDAGDWVLEYSWDVTDLMVVDWKCAMDVVVDVEAKGLHDRIKNLSGGECGTDSDPGNVGWNTRTEESN